MRSWIQERTDVYMGPWGVRGMGKKWHIIGQIDEILKLLNLKKKIQPKAGETAQCLRVLAALQPDGHVLSTSSLIQIPGNEGISTHAHTRCTLR